jgi:hypothetical protein
VSLLFDSAAFRSFIWAFCVAYVWRIGYIPKVNEKNPRTLYWILSCSRRVYNLRSDWKCISTRRMKKKDSFTHTLTHIVQIYQDYMKWVSLSHHRNLVSEHTSLKNKKIYHRTSPWPLQRNDRNGSARKRWSEYVLTWPSETITKERRKGRRLPQGSGWVLSQRGQSFEGPIKCRQSRTKN